VIEERLVGQELSVMAFTDGDSIAMMPAVANYKRLYDNDTGPTTGGMGAYAPAPALTPGLADQVRRQIIEPILAGLQEDRCCFKGALYVGVVLAQDGPSAVEINARFGDPGAQVALPLLETDLLEVLEACVDGTLNQIEVRWRKAAAVAVVLATNGYPERLDPGLPIFQTADLPDEVIVFHAGTRYTDNGTLVTTGGRVLTLIGTGPDLPAAVALAYSAARCMHFDGMHYRTDIGARVLGG